MVVQFFYYRIATPWRCATHDYEDIVSLFVHLPNTVLALRFMITGGIRSLRHNTFINMQQCYDMAARSKSWIERSGESGEADILAQYIVTTKEGRQRRV